MKIVTGYTGTPHITSNDDQARNQGIFGTGNYVLDVGQKFNATLTNATTVTLEDGEGVMQGVHFRIEPGMTEAVSISPGTTGYKRIDLICARYTKEASTGVEDVSLVVIEGTPTTSTPSEPTYTDGDILAGDTLGYAPLWKVTINGLTPSISPVYEQLILQLKKKLLWSVGDAIDTSNPAYWQINWNAEEYSEFEVEYLVTMGDNPKFVRKHLKGSSCVESMSAAISSESGATLVVFIAAFLYASTYARIGIGSSTTVNSAGVGFSEGFYIVPNKIYGIK